PKTGARVAPPQAVAAPARQGVVGRGAADHRLVRRVRPAVGNRGAHPGTKPPGPRAVHRGHVGARNRSALGAVLAAYVDDVPGTGRRLSVVRGRRHHFRLALVAEPRAAADAGPDFDGPVFRAYRGLGAAVHLVAGLWSRIEGGHHSADRGVPGGHQYGSGSAVDGSVAD